MTKHYYLKDSVDHEIDSFAALDDPGAADLHKVRVKAQVLEGIEIYRSGSKGARQKTLRDEKHQSGRLAKFLTDMGDEKPHPRCHAHAIISGAHSLAAELRAIIARVGIRIDDPDNGCWLPENTAALSIMPKRLRKAVPHSRIHRYNYFFWLSREITLTKKTTQKDIREKLNRVELRLQAGKQPKYVMNRKGVGLPI